MIQGMRGYCQQHFWKDALLELKTSLGAGQDEEVWNLRAEETLEATWLLPAPTPIVEGCGSSHGSGTRMEQNRVCSVFFQAAG